jgi:hypothetical protein
MLSPRKKIIFGAGGAAAGSAAFSAPMQERLTMPERRMDFINGEQFGVIDRPADADRSGVDVNQAIADDNTKVMK